MQSLSLGLLRSDIMLESRCCLENNCEKPFCCWKQVEINTIASGFGHLGPISREIQRCTYIMFENLKTKEKKNYKKNLCLQLTNKNKTQC